MSQSTSDRLAAALADRYRIERELGAGGMATVYLAEDLKHHRNVAIKALHAELSAMLGSERFLKEIELTASLQHPHILPLFDSGSADGLLYYVMPYVDGEALRDQLNREKQLPLADAIRIATEAADALEYAHGRGIIHRDIKPENILLHGGHCLVADFGIALAVQQAGGARITQTGLSLGTPQYMSPEQAMGEQNIDARSDIYALGAVTYEMLAGEPPFTGPSAQAILAQVMTAEPKSLTVQRRSVPTNVAAAVATALQKLPADRFPTATAFAHALTDEHFTGSTTTTARGPHTGPGFWKPLSIAALVATAVCAGLLLQVGRDRIAPKNTSPWRVALALGDTVQPLGSVGLSPDGNSIVYSAPGPHGIQLWLRDAAALSPVSVPGSNVVPSYPTFSPDGRRIAFLDPGNNVRVVPRDGSTPAIVADTGLIGGGVAWSGNDHLIVATARGLVSVPANGGVAEPITTVDTTRGEWRHVFPDAVPGSKRVVFTVLPHDMNPVGFRIAVSDPSTGRHTVLMAGIMARYAQPGYLLVAQIDGTLVAVPFDLASGRLTGMPAPLLGGITMGTIFDTWFVNAPTGRLVYPTGATEPSQLVRVSRDGSVVPMDSTWIGNFGSLAASPDGSRVAVSSATELGRSIVVRDIATGSMTTISTEHAEDQDPVFSPDGRTVMFVANSPSGGAIFRETPRSAEPAERLLGFKKDEIAEPAFSGDGRTLFYTRRGGGSNWDIFAHSLDQPTAPDVPIATTAANEINPAPSPNGRWLAYISDESGKRELYVRSMDPSRAERWQVSHSSAISARWSRDGSAMEASSSLLPTSPRTPIA